MVPPSSVGGSGSILRGADGKPEITYVGAEYCPYSAAERWALAVALSRFGTFSHLSGTHSSSTDVYPNTQTLSFYGSSYSSPYVDFQAVEEATNQQVGGDVPGLAGTDDGRERAAQLVRRTGEHPLLRHREQVRHRRRQLLAPAVAGPVAVPDRGPVGRPLEPGGAGGGRDRRTYITAAICTVTGDQPTSVCNTPAITALVKTLGT